MLRKHRCWGLLCLLALAVLAQALAQEALDKSENEKEEDKRVFGGGRDRKYFSQSNKSRVKGRSKVKGKSKTAVGGECQRPEDPVNANLFCTVVSGCSVTCYNGYKLPNGNTKLSLQCVDGEWEVQNTEWTTVPACEPICDPACQNNGICVAPDKCNCPENYSGPQCQYQMSPCLNLPIRPENVDMQCSSSICTLKCLDEHHHFPDGSSVTNMLCKNGVWTPARPDWAVIPSCKRTCEPPCENGGQCLANDMCECPQDFRGPQCQYDKSQCTVNKLKQIFNGDVSCIDSVDALSCTLRCRIGMTFELAPVSQYICYFSDGVFRPEPPRCIVVGPDVEIMPPDFHMQMGSYRNYSQHTSYSSSVSSYSSNTSWTDLLSHHHQSSSSSFTDLNFIPHVVSTEKLPTSGVCYTWSGDHYKTFDGNILSFHSNCTYTFVRDAVDDTFIVNLEWEADHRRVDIYAQDREYFLTKTSNRVPVLMYGARQITIPASLTGITVEFQGNYVLLSLTALGVNIKWDGNVSM